MKLLEYHGKQVLQAAGVAIPQGRLVESPDEAIRFLREVGRPVMLKAQLHQGKRGKAGLIRRVTTARECLDGFLHIADEELRGERVSAVLAEAAVDAEEELYLAITIDDVAGAPLLVASRRGGIDVEQASAGDSEALVQVALNPSRGLRRHEALAAGKRLGLSGPALVGFSDASLGAFRAFRDKDATLVEINPLFLTKEGKCVAGDAKLEINDDAMYRQSDLASLRMIDSSLDPVEREAREKGVTFVNLEGDIAVLSAGAGFTMALLDLMQIYGLRPANFCDAMGGSGPEVMSHIADLVIRKANTDPGVKAVLFNIIISATPLENVVNGMVRAFSVRPCTKPVIGSLRAMDASTQRMSLAEGIKRLEAIGFRIFPEIREALEHVAALNKAGDPA